MMEPTRCHFSVVFENVAKFFWQLLPAFILPMISSDWLTTRLWLLLILIPACFLVALLIQILTWRMTWLSADADNLMIASGLIWKKHQAIPFEKINTIDLSRNLFQRVFGTCRIKIDTGAVTGGSKKGAEVNLVFSLQQAERIRSHVLHLAAGVASLHDDYADGPTAIFRSASTQPLTAPDGSQYVRREQTGNSMPFNSAAGADAAGRQPAAEKIEIRARSVDFFLYGLTQSKFLGAIVVITSAMTLLNDFFGERLGLWLEQYIEPAWQQISSWYLLMAVLLGLLSILLFYMIATLISIAYAIIRFYHFRASREADNIHIEYGLLTVKSYTIPIRNIHAVIISQNMLRQWLRQCSVEIVSIGYGDEKNEVALLFPLVRLKELENLMGRILPEYREELELTPAPPNALRRYLLIPLVLLCLGMAVPAFFQPLILLGLIPLLPLLIFNRWLNYRHAGISYTADRLEIRTGGFTSRRFRVRMSAVQSVSAASTPLTERAGLRSYRIDYHAPALRASILVRYLREKHLNELRHLLDPEMTGYEQNP